jgi:hypothetical protein
MFPAVRFISQFTINDKGVCMVRSGKNENGKDEWVMLKLIMKWKEDYDKGTVYYTTEEVLVRCRE